MSKWHYWDSLEFKLFNLLLLKFFRVQDSTATLLFLCTNYNPEGWKKKWKKSKAASSISQATPKLQNKRGNTQKPKTRTKEAEEQQPHRGLNNPVCNIQCTKIHLSSASAQKKKNWKEEKRLLTPAPLLSC